MGKYPTLTTKRQGFEETAHIYWISGYIIVLVFMHFVYPQISGNLSEI